MNVGELQRKLSLWAEQDKNHKFFDLYHLLYDKDWLRLAHDYVSQNAGSKTAGCDGINMRLYDEQLETNLQLLAAELKSESFEPYPVRRVLIPKSNGGRRQLGIASIKDRIVQEALRMILEPIYEVDFCQRSYGFRPNRCTMDAVKYVAFNTTGPKTYYWIIEGDISSYFDSIHHQKLCEILKERIRDKKILRLIWKFLRAGVMEGKLFRDTKLGVPQGGIVSPLLSNVYLNKLDQYMEQYCSLPPYRRRQRRSSGQANFLYARYADDWAALCNGTRQQAENLKRELSGFLKETLHLELSEEKTKVTHINDGFKFLGFWIQRCPGNKGMTTKVTIPKDAVDKHLTKIRAVINRSTHQEAVNAKILSLNRIITGWCLYYQYTSMAATQFHKLNPTIFWSMAHWLGGKFRISMPEVMKRYRKGITFATSRYCLKMPSEFKTQRYRAKTSKPNPYLYQQAISREELPQEVFWAGFERRVGMADLREQTLERDGYVCQICGLGVTNQLGQVDHIKPVRRFKRPIEANHLENLWTLCVSCHQCKTESDRRMESRMP